LLLYRSGDEVHAIGDRCSHRGGPLHEGTCDGETVTCPWHAASSSERRGIVRDPRGQAALVRRADHGGRIEVRRNPQELHA